MAVYFVQAGDGAVKVGYSRNPRNRIRSLQTSVPFRLNVLGIAENGSLEDERALHWLWSSIRIVGEWFQPAAAILEEAALAKKYGAFVCHCVAYEGFTTCQRDHSGDFARLVKLLKGRRLT